MPPSPPRLASLFPHVRGPAEFRRELGVGVLREYPALWVGPDRTRHFAAADPTFPNVPLKSVDPAAVPEPSHGPDPRAPGAGIRDKVWQRLLMEDAGLLPQPGFAAVRGTRVEARNAPWVVRVGAVDCRPCEAALVAANVPGAVLVVEGVESGFVAHVGSGSIRLESQNPAVAALLDPLACCGLPRAEWPVFVRKLCSRPLPLGVTKAAFDPSAELADALAEAPGSYILKPRHGSNGFGVARIVSHPDGHFRVESDCPDTARYLDEFPHDPSRRGRDRVEAVAGHRGRFADRAAVGLTERMLGESILEEEIPQHRADGSFFEPRVVVQRMRGGGGESFATLGAICKRIDTPVGASVARDFAEESLADSLARFLRDRVPAADLPGAVGRTRDEILTAGDRVRAVLLPAVEAHGAWVHQLGIDSRLCWNPDASRAECWFLEFQFGIGRIDPAAWGPNPPGEYQPRAELTAAFGPERG